MRKLNEINLIHIDEKNLHELKIYKQLRENAFTADNSFIADSPKVVNIILQTNLKIKSILATQDYYDEFSQLLTCRDDMKLYVITKEKMQQIVGHKIHHNCMLHGIRPNENSLEELDDNILMLDEITSTENVGSIARSAAALGINSYLLPRKAPHPYSRRALRVSMGHISKLKVSIYDDIFDTIKFLKLAGYKIYGAEVTPNATKLSQVIITKKWVLLMGHEGKGLSTELINICDEIVSIEMSEDVRSLNVAVAASLIMYKFKNS